jgi:antitoxin ParD1/3/4
MALHADLGSQLETTVEELVRSGRFESKDDVLREGVRLVERREHQLKELDEILARSAAELDAGLGIPADEVFDELERHLAAMAK